MGVYAHFLGHFDRKNNPEMTKEKREAMAAMVNSRCSLESHIILFFSLLRKE